MPPYRVIEVVGSSLELICLESLQEIRGIEERWRALEQRSIGDMAYFQSFDWCENWCAHYAPVADGRLYPKIRVYAARRNGELVMLWPLMLDKSAFAQTSLTFIGSRLSQYGGILCNRPRVSAQDIQACWASIKADTEADLIAVNSVPHVSPLLEIDTVCTIEDESSIVDLSDNGANCELVNCTSASKRRNRKKRRKKLADGMELTLATAAGGSAEYKTFVALIFRWKMEWFRETGRPSHGLDPKATKNFLSDLNDGAVVLMLLRDGIPIAGELGFRQGDHFYSYIGAFDWSLQRLSPGRVQIEEALHWLIDQNVTQYDLMGAPTIYKQDMATRSPRMVSMMEPITLTGYLYVFGWRKYARPLLKNTFYGLAPHRRRVVTQFSAWLSNLRRRPAGGHSASLAKPEPRTT